MYSFPQDKVNHFFYGAFIGTFGVVAVLLVTRSPSWAIAGALLAVIAGGVKEWLDARANKKAGAAVHGVEWKDALFTGIGGIPPAVPLLVLRLIQ